MREGIRVDPDEIFGRLGAPSQNNMKKRLFRKIPLCRAGVCLGGKSSPFSAISQNSMLEKWTLHKIQCKKNGLFTKFNTKKKDSSQNVTT